MRRDKQWSLEFNLTTSHAQLHPPIQCCMPSPRIYYECQNFMGMVVHLSCKAICCQCYSNPCPNARQWQDQCRACQGPQTCHYSCCTGWPQCLLFRHCMTCTQPVNHWINSCTSSVIGSSTLTYHEPLTPAARQLSGVEKGNGSGHTFIGSWIW